MFVLSNKPCRSNDSWKSAGEHDMPWDAPTVACYPPECLIDYISLLCLFFVAKPGVILLDPKLAIAEWYMVTHDFTMLAVELTLQRRYRFHVRPRIYTRIR